MAKTIKPAPVSTVIPGLQSQAAAIASAYKKAESAQVSIGKAVIKAASALKADQVETFVSMTKTALEPVLSAASLKVEATRIKKVLAGILSGAITPNGDETLRQMYAAVKKPHGPQGAAHNNASESDDDDETGNGAKPAKAAQITAGQVADMPDDARRVFLATVLWGYSEPELTAALEYVETRSADFIRWAQDAAQKAQLAEIESAVTAKPAKKPAAKRVRKAA